MGDREEALEATGRRSRDPAHAHFSGFRGIDEFVCFFFFHGQKLFFIFFFSRLDQGWIKKILRLNNNMMYYSREIYTKFNKANFFVTIFVTPTSI